jgi:MoaA/NifB/PqqE/SkfB family radical SAM enzyme
MRFTGVNPKFPFDRRRNMELVIDVVGSCNLRCPSCPVGNIGAVNPTGLIDKDLFTRLIAKAAREYHIYRVSLYNWSEPLLHPELPDFVRIVKSHDLYCALSSNLNILRNADELFRANPDEFRISLSGFTQPVYEQTHAKGNIERVKENMRLLQEAGRRTGNVHTRVVVYYHKYRHNLHEAEKMRAYVTSLGFGWMENFAFYMPIEKAMSAAEGRLDPEERAFVDRMFALPVVNAIEAAKEFAHEPCRLWNEQIVLDLRGNATLCCALYDFGGNTIGSFLDMSPEQLMRAKENHPTCASCTRNGLHRYYEYFAHPKLRPQYEAMIAENLKRPLPPRRPKTVSLTLVGDVE